MTVGPSGTSFSRSSSSPLDRLTIEVLEDGVPIPFLNDVNQDTQISKWVIR